MERTAFNAEALINYFYHCVLWYNFTRSVFPSFYSVFQNNAWSDKTEENKVDVEMIGFYGSGMHALLYACIYYSTRLKSCFVLCIR